MLFNVPPCLCLRVFSNEERVIPAHWSCDLTTNYKTVIIKSDSISFLPTVALSFHSKLLLP